MGGRASVTTDASASANPARRASMRTATQAILARPGRC
jgi:hypothetical protein